MKAPSSYEEVLQMAGAKVLAFEHFGSYQGDWIAKVEYEGKIGWIKDYYGSCSVCDALHAEFDWSEDVPLSNVVDFAKRYITEITDFDTVMKEVSRNSEWDMEVNEMVEFLNKNK